MLALIEAAGLQSIPGNCSRLSQHNRLSSPVPGKRRCVPTDDGWYEESADVRSAVDMGRESVGQVHVVWTAVCGLLPDPRPQLDMIESILNPLERLRLVSTGIIMTDSFTPPIYPIK